MFIDAKVENKQLVIELKGTDAEGGDYYISTTEVPLSDFFKIENGDDENNFWLLIREAYHAIEEFDNFDPRNEEDRKRLEELSRAADVAKMKIVRYVLRSSNG